MSGPAGFSIERLDAGFGAWDEMLAMILRSFASMSGRIDPPSSATRLTPESLRQKALDEYALAARLGSRLAGCAFLADKGDHFYLGKLAVEPHLQGTGIGRALLAHAETHARDEGRPAIELQTRIELVENHRLFERLGYRETARSSHPGFERPTTLTFRKQLA